MATISVDVDLDEFDTDDLISELERKANSKYYKLGKDDLIRLAKICNNVLPKDQQRTLLDEYWDEVFAEMKRKFTVFQAQKLIK